ncbi:hypothetical protein SUSP_002167 [Sulfurospirillum sp. 'SP']|nr:hypothetical protein [Sulfurospirillum sp. 'SP']WNY99749.1 hypothetical protein SUSP_002167 [Sulfurospirillum sp. 'SP']
MEYFTLENIVKAVGLAIAILTFLSKIKIFFSKKSAYRGDYNLAEKLLNGDKYPNVHDFVLEKWYLAITGKSLDASIIRFYLEQKNPSQKLRDFHKALDYLVVKHDTKGRTYVRLKKPYEKEWIFQLSKWLNFIFYFCSAFIGTMPLILMDKLVNQGMLVITLGIFTVIIFYVLAFSFLERFQKYKIAKQLIEREIYGV